MKKKVKDLTLSDMVRCCDNFEECNSCPYFSQCGGEMFHFRFILENYGEEEIEVEE